MSDEWSQAAEYSLFIYRFGLMSDEWSQAAEYLLLITHYSLLIIFFAAFLPLTSAASTVPGAGPS